MVFFGFIFSFLLFAWYARDLPAPGKLSQDTTKSTVFYDRDGKVLYEMYKDKNRVPVALSDISPYLQEATVSIEDKNFYKHGGISESGIIRSIFNLLLGRGIEGGSTITQQLIKTVLLSSQRTIPRKIKEMILSFEVERKYNKNQILEMYLNDIPYGGTYYGVGSAAMGYFDKQPKDLNLVESAILAGLPQNPSYYSPFIGQKNAWKGRTTDVLRRMREDGKITSDQEKQADKDLDSVQFNSSATDIQAPHFVFFVKDQIEKQFGSDIFNQGVKVKTTLSLDVQQAAEKIVKAEIANLKPYHATNAGVVVLDSQTGEILAMVGSYDYNDPNFGKYNVALALRQPGSSVKPITYGLAFEKGYTPATVIMDVKTTFANQGGKDYTPVNYDGKYHGPIQLRFGLGNSINVVAVKLLAMVGIKDFLQKAYDMGLTSLAPTDANVNRFGLSVTLGGGETTLLDLTSAYSVFAAGGIKRDTSYLQEIDDFNNKPIYKQVRGNERRVFSPEVSFLVSHILSDNNARTMEFGPNSYLHVAGRTVAVKTGTTDDKRDNWTIGFTNSITVGVWVGNNDNSPMNQAIASGITGASPIWHDIMVELLKKYSDGIMAKPDSVVAQTIDAYLGGLPHGSDPTRSEYFIKGTEPKDISPYYKTLKISKSNGQLANDVEIKNGNYDSKEYIVITENDPVSTDGINRWQQGIDDWARQQSDPKYHPPTETSTASADSVVVSIKNPSNQTTISGNSVEVKAHITTIDPLTNVKIYLNNSQVASIDGSNQDVDQTLNNVTNGVYILKLTASNNRGNAGDSSVQFGVNMPWNAVTPTQSP